MNLTQLLCVPVHAYVGGGLHLESEHLRGEEEHQ